ncbi:hypothetical protein [Granulosicoccus antarcticus]|uniref:Uncharacterized protein n=1 Tax=Granulosicoccus antarcticus IMCC3135 TaxID=1192854 RepID=A0A2Z2NYN0_9GAMM|nr:hypothetical protein [Granulosicoccus antarcticus]ASJ76423.1 hypothetical protein IMCC3135_31880 [Granulosicoccus antarcticus IMCC3135]
MSIKDSFTDDEWFLLSAMPGLIGAAMSNAAPSGIIGTIKEMSATMRASAQAKYDHPESELISELITKAANWEEAKEKAADYRERAQAHVKSANVHNREDLQNMAVNDCRTAARLVEERCSEADAKVYKEWTINVARSVAEAAKEGSILGFGGERVSAPERELLSRIEATLGIKSGLLLA